MSAQTGLLDPYSAQSAGGGLNALRNEGYPSKETAYGEGAKNPTHGEAFQFWGRPVFKNSYGELYCPGFTGATYAKNPWDLCQIYSYKLPGITTVGVSRSIDVDKKKAAGTSGARLTLHGVNLADVDIRVKIWTPEQLRQFANIWTALFPALNQAPSQGFNISHPNCAQHNVHAIILIGGAGWEPGDTPGSKVFSIRAMEYVQPQTKKATKTVTEAKGSINDPAKAETPGSNKENRKP